MQNLEPAINAWLAAIGKDAVVTTREELAAYEQATYATSQRIPAAIFPGWQNEFFQNPADAFRPSARVTRTQRYDNQVTRRGHQAVLDVRFSAECSPSAGGGHR